MKTFILILIIAAAGGYWYFHTHSGATISGTANSIATQTETDIDAGTQKSFSGVSVDAQVYYLRNRNYGSSGSANICTAATSNGGLGDIISAMQKLGSTVSCIVDPNYPSKSFTLTVPSLANHGQYFCTDQNGYVGLVPSVTTAPFRAGLACK